jgi:hypothetical protein
MQYQYVFAGVLLFAYCILMLSVLQAEKMKPLIECSKQTVETEFCKNLRLDNR